MATCQSTGLRIFSLVTFIFMLLTLNTYYVNGANKRDHPSNDRIHPSQDAVKKVELGMELYPTGSRLPDCSHACGACMPCKRVMVSFKCSVSEPCPVVYRCMCKGKYYHVPSN